MFGSHLRFSVVDVEAKGALYLDSGEQVGFDILGVGMHGFRSKISTLCGY